MEVKNSGLKLAKRDRRDFSYEKNFGAPALHSEDLFLAPFAGIKNQLNTSLCTAFAVTKLREDTERVVLSPEFQFMLSKKIEGNWTTFGANQYDALKAAVQGALEMRLSPYSVDKDDQLTIANWNKWPQNLIDSAYIHKAGSYFSV